MESPSRGNILALTLAVEGSLLILAFGLGWCLGMPLKISSADLGPGLLWGPVAALPLLLFLALMWWRPIGPFRALRTLFVEFVQPLFAKCRPIDLALIAGLAGFGEEMLFRGIGQTALAHWLGLGMALLLTNLVFGLVHALSPTYAVVAGAMGLYLGLLLALTNNLVLVCLTHATYDFIAFLWIVRSPRAAKTDSYPSNQVPQPAADTEFCSQAQAPDSRR